MFSPFSQKQDFSNHQAVTFATLRYMQKSEKIKTEVSEIFTDRQTDRYCKFLFFSLIAIYSKPKTDIDRPTDRQTDKI